MDLNFDSKDLNRSLLLSFNWLSQNSFSCRLLADFVKPFFPNVDVQDILKSSADEVRKSLNHVFPEHSLKIDLSSLKGDEAIHCWKNLYTSLQRAESLKNVEDNNSNAEDNFLPFVSIEPEVTQVPETAKEKEDIQIVDLFMKEHSNISPCETVQQFNQADTITQLYTLLHSSKRYHKMETAASTVLGYSSSIYHLFCEVITLMKSGTSEEIATVMKFISRLVEFSILVHLLGTDYAHCAPNTDINNYLFHFGKLEWRKIFWDNGIVPLLTFLSFTYCDRVRFCVIDLYMRLSRLHTNPRQWPRDISFFVTSIYLSKYEMQNWIGNLQEQTFKTCVVDLTQQDVKNILQCYYAFSVDIYPTDFAEIRKGVEDKIDNAIQKSGFKGKVFVKLSTRSPKDAPFQTAKYKTLKNALAAEWIDRYNFDVKDMEELPRSIKEAIAQICSAKCMAVANGAEALELLARSDRVHFDLDEALLNTYLVNTKLVIREWTDIPIHFELRGFVRNRKLNALTQYFSPCYFPWIKMDDWKEIKERVLSYFKVTDIKNIAEPLLPVDHCVIDFVALKDEVKIIELNPFGLKAGPGLFNWEKDEQVMYHGPFEFRVVADINLTPIVV